METDTGYAVGGQNSPVRVDPEWHQVRLASWRSPTEYCGTAVWSAFFGSADPGGTRFNASFVTGFGCRPAQTLPRARGPFESRQGRMTILEPQHGQGWTGSSIASVPGGA